LRDGRGEADEGGADAPESRTDGDEETSVVSVTERARERGEEGLDESSAEGEETELGKGGVEAGADVEEDLDVWRERVCERRDNVSVWEIDFFEGGGNSLQEGWIHLHVL
jgi:hypothetical protein